LLVISASDSGIVVVNRLPVEDYLRGVVPLEIGPRRGDERGAVEAQAVAARSYTLARIQVKAGSPWQLLGNTGDQAYGGVDAERPESDAAVKSTAGLALTFRGKVVLAPYFSTCGGSTAGSEEVFRSDGEPYLKRVSDRRPGQDGRAWCDISPSFAWERSLSASELQAVLERYLRQYASVAAGRLPSVVDTRAIGQTPSGRVSGLEIVAADGQRWTVRGNDIRFVLRSASGAILPSTYFSLAAARSPDGGLARLALRGAGNGHGVGMCQWGAIGRARAGHDFRAILRAYYPGTEVSRIN